MPSETTKLLPKTLDDLNEEEEKGTDPDRGSLTSDRMEVEEEEVFATLRILPPVVDDARRDSVVPLHDTRSMMDSLQSTFWEDCKHFSPGSMPHSTIVGITIGVFCGVVAYLYYTVLEYLLEFCWKTLPDWIVTPHVPEAYYWIWIPALGSLMALGVGASVKYLGEPGDLSYTVQCVHDKAYIGMDHVLPMLMASQFSILGGGSLGPEAPLVAICASFRYAPNKSYHILNIV